MAVRDLIDRYGGKALRYSSVSAIGVALTWLLLALFLAIGWAPWLSNFLAVMIASYPAYVLNRAWVWNKSGAHDMKREVLPFWGMSLLGLILSTGGVAIVSHYSDNNIWVFVTNIAAFGVLWVGKFLILELVLFRGEHVTVAAAEPWVAADPEET